MLGKLLAISLSCAALSSCAGYQLGSSKPTHLTAVKSIDVPLFENETLEPRLATLATNSLVDSITRDGTYKIATTSDSDATLIASIRSLDYSTRRSGKLDTLRASELYLKMDIDWKLISSNNSILSRGKAHGGSQFSLSENEQLSRTNAMADATKNAAEKITQQLANGF